MPHVGGNRRRIRAKAVVVPAPLLLRKAVQVPDLAAHTDRVRGGCSSPARERNRQCLVLLTGFCGRTRSSRIRWKDKVRLRLRPGRAAARGIFRGCRFRRRLLRRHGFRRDILRRRDYRRGNCRRGIAIRCVPGGGKLRYGLPSRCVPGGGNLRYGVPSRCVPGGRKLRYGVLSRCVPGGGNFRYGVASGGRIFWKRLRRMCCFCKWIYHRGFWRKNSFRRRCFRRNISGRRNRRRHMFKGRSLRRTNPCRT